jgi:hypothetical protein
MWAILVQQVHLKNGVRVEQPLDEAVEGSAPKSM